MKISFLVILGIILVILGFVGFVVPITDSGLTVLEAEELCKKRLDAISSQEQEIPKVCEHAKFFNSIYFLFAIGLILIFWSGFLERRYGSK